MKDLVILKNEIEEHEAVDYGSAMFWETKLNEVTEALLEKDAHISHFQYLMKTREYMASVYKGHQKDATDYLRGVKKDLLAVINRNID